MSFTILIKALRSVLFIQTSQQTGTMINITLTHNWTKSVLVQEYVITYNHCAHDNINKICEDKNQITKCCHTRQVSILLKLFVDYNCKLLCLYITTFLLYRLSRVIGALLPHAKVFGSNLTREGYVPQTSSCRTTRLILKLVKERRPGVMLATSSSIVMSGH